MKIRQMIPMIAVKDIRRALGFYTEKLGFQLVSPEDKIDEWRWCSLKRDEARVMISETEDGHARPAGNEEYFSCLLYFYPDDVTVLHEEYESRGVHVTALEETFYGMKEFSLRDPDGHLLSFGRDID